MTGIQVIFVFLLICCTTFLAIEALFILFLSMCTPSVLFLSNIILVVILTLIIVQNLRDYLSDLPFRYFRNQTQALTRH